MCNFKMTAVEARPENPISDISNRPKTRCRHAWTATQVPAVLSFICLLVLTSPSAAFAATVCDVAAIPVQGGATIPAKLYSYADKSTAAGATVCNPTTSAVTTVAARIQDPAGTPTAGQNTWVETADGYHFFVKAVGDKYYIIDAEDPTVTNLVVETTSYPSPTASFSIKDTATDNTDNILGAQTAAQWASFTAQPVAPPPVVTPADTADSGTGFRSVETAAGGTNGGDGALWFSAGDGGTGSTGPELPNPSTVTGTYVATSNIGVNVQSTGGDGGSGGDGYLGSGSGTGGDGGKGGTVDLSYTGAGITTSGDDNHGIFARSRSGRGGPAGDTILGFGAGSGTGGAGSDGGSVTVTTGSGNIVTNGDGAHGIYGLSVGNNGGSGGASFGFVGNGGSGGIGGKGGVVSLTNNGGISTFGIGSHGIFAQSIGGGGGDAGTSGGIVAFSGVGDAGGTSGNASGTNNGTILTDKKFARGIFVQSIGGGGGSGGDAGGLFALGGTGAGGGDAGTATALNTGTISTKGEGSDGIMVQSIAGSGGGGGGGGGLVAIGGSGEEGGNGNKVSASNTGNITTKGDGARGIVAQSIGGGGGDGGSGGGIVTIGGSGEGGGTGGLVTVSNYGAISTGGDDATGILAQSIGGGGGNGGTATSVSAFFAVAIGGSAGDGGDGGEVDITLDSSGNSGPSSITTVGDRSYGVLAQSVGGGGGNGGGATAIAAGFGGAVTVAIGGDGGKGGAGKNVSLLGSNASNITTGGVDSAGILMQSIGGGGGNGGYSYSLAASAGPVSASVAVGLGGDGAVGGEGGTVTNGVLTNGQLTAPGFSGQILTTKARSQGMILQSIGGGGGNGGIAIAAAAAVSLGASGTVTVGVGGAGEGGGKGGTVNSFNLASITTFGEYSDGMVVQSIGGGGGNGGGTISASAGFSAGAAAGVNIGVGGSAGKASNGGAVNLIANGNLIQTVGKGSQGVVVQSIGGGGGNGGYAVAAGVNGAVGAAATVTVGLGGAGGKGGAGGTVSAEIGADVTTGNVDSGGVVIQSIGGGGGTGGFSVSAGLAGAGGAAGGVSVGLGGSGDAGGAGGLIAKAEVNGNVTTTRDRSGGVLVQSIGGGGGNGGFNVSASIAGAGAAAGSIGVGLGGEGSGGGSGGVVNANITGNVSTGGEQSSGVVVQSIGGSGGNGGFNISAAASGAGIGSGSIAVGLGGDGGAGATSSQVTARVSGSVMTTKGDSTGILAQSVGGSGGNGGFNVSAAIAGAGVGSGGVSVGLGGDGALGANGAGVNLTSTNTITTVGDRSSAFVAQSVGGGGGNGGFNVSATLVGAGVGSGAIGVGLGGTGDGGGAAGLVRATATGAILTTGVSSSGFVAQSLGGGGGNGGFNVTAGGAGAGVGAGAVSVGIGGSGDKGGKGGVVIAQTGSTVETQKENSTAVLAQSVGGGGGNGGFNVSATLTGGGVGAGGVSVGLGGKGADASSADAVTLTTGGAVTTFGAGSSGVVAQAIGGGGGNGGFNVTADLSGGGVGAGTIGVGLGGGGGDGGDGALVTATANGAIYTEGDSSSGFVAQSLGGGGGNGGFNVTANAVGGGTGAGAVSVGLGGQGGGAGAGKVVIANVNNTVTTWGDSSTGILAQSVGGSGGNGGFNVSASVAGAGVGSGAVGVGLGGNAGVAANADAVTLNAQQAIWTEGKNSSGVVAQSIGGGGGNGGFNVTAAMAGAGTGAGAVGVGLGGKGAAGGQAGIVTATVNGAITTDGFASSGFVAQSLGGGGGNGGFNVTANGAGAGTGAGAVSVGLGGKGGAGSEGKDVIAVATGKVLTKQDSSTGILAQSVGGGGGNGGFNVSATIVGAGTGAGGISVGLGGDGATGADAGNVNLTVDETVTTLGNDSSGVVAQSLGGGGGNGGFNVSANLAGAGTGAGAIGVGLGGTGKGGGAAGIVTAEAKSAIYTEGNSSSGFVAQSLGGGGGNGGFNVTANAAGGGTGAGAVSVGLGGQGGGAGDGNIVNAIIRDTVTTTGNSSTGILAQSIGGSGGNGGFNVSASISGAGTGAVAVGVGLGGDGGTGANAMKVTLLSEGTVSTSGESSSGVVAQSIGGGGGNGGFNVTASLGGAGKGAAAIGVGLGGSGEGGGQAGEVDATSTGQIFTNGVASSGFVAQSIGGGGGNGGFNVTATLAGGGKGAAGVGVGLGGSGAGGGNGAKVDATVRASVVTLKNQSTGVLAQSVGGGGGNGGFNVTATLAGGGTGAAGVGVGLGGSGDGGGDGGIVNLNLFDNVTTLGQDSAGAIAQSIGGGGGNGGFNVTATLAGGGKGAVSASVGLGGTGAGGGNAVAVTNKATSNISTAGATSTGLLVQSVGGGGGNGGLNVSANISVAGKGAGGASVGLGGSAGTGGFAGAVSSTLVGDVSTIGTYSSGVVVQSLGGGGGNGGVNVSGSITGSGKSGAGVAVGLGGSGGTGGAASTAFNQLTGNVTTEGEYAGGILVQSAGGGGGSGGINVSAAINLSSETGGAIGVGLGGSGGGGGDGKAVTSIVAGDIITLGLNSAGLTVQSLGGGGGNGGLNVAGAISITGKSSGSAAIGVGGFGGKGGVADVVNSDFTGIASTLGNNATALTAQSIGGGGGNGATNVSGAISIGKDKSGAFGIGVGGFGGDGGKAGSVRQAATGQFLTRGDDSIGILTQSLGGGGGSGGTNITAALSLTRDTSGAIGIGVGGFGGGGQNAGDLTRSNVIGGVTTLGKKSTAILTQSIGGGGGSGGTNITAAVSITQNKGGAIGLGLGGFGGGAGDGKEVISTLQSWLVTSGEQSTIDTFGSQSIGMLAQSVGGGGGNGGLNVSGSVSLTGKSGAAVSLGVGGFGGGGGNAGDVTLNAVSDITTRGNASDGIFAQSLGGGGGVGGTNISGSLALTKPSGTDTILSISAGVGGFGGGGGDAGGVNVSYSGLLTAVPLTEQPDGSFVRDLTSGANGLVAQSIGGGGGNGGTNVSAGLAIASKPGAGQSNRSKSYGLLVGVGGFGGTGGNAGNVGVDVVAGSIITAHGTGKSGLLAQSVGGGGGNGGLNVSAGIVSDTALIVGIGGFGGNAGTGGNVDVTSVADIFVSTNPTDLVAPTTQEFKLLLEDTLGSDVAETLAGQFDDKGLRRLFIDAGLSKEDSNETEGSAGLLAQSIGGGGGNGGLNVSGGIALSKDGKLPSVTFGVGGFGGAGNVSGDVSVDHTGTIQVAGNWKHGIFAQSIAGGGGNGGMNVTGQISYAKSEKERNATDFSVVGGLGGHGGAGADAGDVKVIAEGNINAVGYHARGIFAQSIGGGGGTGGMNIAAVATQNSQPLAMGIGGFGSGGGHAGNVTVSRGSVAIAEGIIVTNGVGGHGIEASSIGGGGGDAGVNAVLGISKRTGPKDSSDGGSANDRTVPTHTGVDDSVIPNYNAVLDELEGKSAPPPAAATTEKPTYSGVIAIGGSAGSAGNGGAVDVDHFGMIVTQQDDSNGVFGQSIGGGGGNAALNVGQIFNKGAATKTRGFAVGIGGGTGNGGDGAEVEVRNTGEITTLGDNSHGLFAQSIGGGGGNVGYDSVSNKAANGYVSIRIGRTGGTGGTGGNVFASSIGTVATAGEGSHGIFAQSVGNGGGSSSSSSVSLKTPGEDDKPGNGYNLALGLEGGEGGSAGTVGVSANGEIFTFGTKAHAIFAQSIGGGGGSAGGVGSGTGEGTSIAINLGGTGGKGGTGDVVTVNSNALIETVGDGAIGILAQSVGGSGGTGGYVKNVAGKVAAAKSAKSPKDIGESYALSLGGSGGTGMASGAINVTTMGSILTQGDAAHGVYAQSIGGGGGISGLVTTSVLNRKATIASQNILSIGGSGGTGAVSGAVSVTNGDTITVLGARSVGIFTQSIGGGGGDAQNVTNEIRGKSADQASNNNILIGGSGGDGAKGADVTVTNTVDGAVTTFGVSGYGILAQSIGGGGGTGSTTRNNDVSTTSGAGKSTENINIGLGGFGGTGATGGIVRVTNAGTVATMGDGAHGIIAQSVGGGGGIGGASLNGGASLKPGSTKEPSLALSLGGLGGSGGVGGAVSVINSGTITVNGEGASGIYAQSIGGGGGIGGMSVALSPQSIQGALSAKTMSKIALGGSGGTGGDSGNVLVNHTGTIVVNSANGYGIFAQSVSGGGGNVGMSLSSPIATAADFVFSNALGARDGSTGKVGTVTVNSTGDIILNGANSQAILDQAIAGGGGSSVTAITLGDAAATTAILQSLTMTGTLSLGGNDVSGTNASNVAQSHGGNILTMKDRSPGIVLQSIGGGGGQSAATIDIAAGTKAVMDVRVGAINTSDAAGGDVAATRNGDMATLGAASVANHVQSIGGGGGRMVLTAAGNGEAVTNLILGSDPSFRNNGGNIRLTLSGAIETLGDNASAQVVQSIGAGGGSASLIGMDRASVLLGAQDDSTGDGGDITITNVGDITTAGDIAHGFVVQTIGGGGGFVSTDMLARDINVVFSAANKGDGGTINLTNTGDIMVSGAGSVGVLAQSLGGGGGAIDSVFFGTAGGLGAGGDIDLTMQGNILATGRGGIAVLAQSEGKNSAGDIRMSLDGVIMGGSGPSSKSAAIMVDGGNANTIELSAYSYLLAANNQILRSGTGDEAVSLKGQALGNIDLGAGQNSFTIERGATFYAQDYVDLGATGEMIVNGSLILGGEAVLNATTDNTTSWGPTLTSGVKAGAFSVAPLVFQTTKVNGNLTLGNTALYTLDVSFRRDGKAGIGSDLIDVTGDGTLNGTIQPVLHRLDRALPLVIVDVSGRSIDAGANVIDTALIDYSIGLNGSTGDGSSIDLVADVDFVTASMNRNQTNVGRYINGVLNGEGSGVMGDLFAVMANFQTEEEVIALMSQLTTGDYASTQISAHRGALGFAEALQTCDRPASTRSTLEDTRCHWLTVSQTDYSRDVTNNALHFSSAEYGINGGFRFPVDDQTYVTFGGSHETIAVSNGTTFAADGTRDQLGAAVQTTRGPWEFSGSILVGRSSYDASRQIAIEGTLPDGIELDATSVATTNQIVSHTNLRFGLGYRYVLDDDRFYIRPGLDIDATRLRSSSAQEVGNRYGVTLQDTTQWTTTANASIEVGGDVDLSGEINMRSFMRAEAIFGDTENMHVDARLPGTSAKDGSFRNYADVDARSTRLTLGATFINTGNDTFADVTYEHQTGTGSRSNTVGVKLGINF
jgi:hypothetical protein